MNKNFTTKLKSIVENPYLNIIVGLILLYTGIAESIAVYHEIEKFELGVHHGVVPYAILHILKSVPDRLEGLEFITKAFK